MNDDEVITFPQPTRPKSADSAFSHVVYAFQRIGKRFGRYREVGEARVPPCQHCGQPATEPVKVFLNRLPLGGFAGGLLVRPSGTPPPQIKRDFPGQLELDEDEILPES